MAGLSPAERMLAAAAAAWSAAAPGGPRSGRAGPYGTDQLRDRIRAGEDPLGEAFCRIRTVRQRRRAGQTFTPGPVVGSMVAWAARTLAPAQVVDPGAGSARFLAAAGRRWRAAQGPGLRRWPGKVRARRDGAAPGPAPTC